MRAFLLALERGKKNLEERDRFHRTFRSFGFMLLPACLLLGFCLYRFRWELFLFALVVPLVAASLIWRRKPEFPLRVVARTFDSSFQLQDILTTAQEFQTREQESPVLADLMSAADRVSRKIDPGIPSRKEHFNKLLLLPLFILLALLNLWRQTGISPLEKAFSDLQKAISDLKNAQPEKSEMQNQLNSMKDAKSDEQFNKAADGMSKGIQEGNSENSLKQMGKTFEKNGQTHDVGKVLSQGKTGEASRKMSDLAKQLGSGISPKQKGDLGKTLQEAKNNLSEPSAGGMKQAIEDMQKSLDSPKDLQKAAEKLAQKLDEAGKQQEAMKNLQKKLEEVKQAKEKDMGKDQKLGGKPDFGREGINPAFGKKSSEEGADKNNIPPRGDATEKPGNSESQHGKGEGKGSQKKDPKGGSGKGNPRTDKPSMAFRGYTPPPGSKRAGGELMAAPRELLKNAESKLPQAGTRISDNGKEYEIGTGPRMLADYQKGALLTDREKLKLKLEQEKMARGREANEFSQKHHIPNSFRNFLRDFFVQPSK